MDLFSYNNANGNLRDRVSQGKAHHVIETGFMENAGEALRMELYENSSISKLLNSGLERDRAREIWKKYEAGEIPDTVIDQHTVSVMGYPTVDFESIGLWANDNIGTAFLTNEQIQERIRDDLKEKREVGSDIFNRANNWGKFGQFTGATSGVLMDPIYIPTYFIGVGAAARGATWLSRFGRAALTVGAIEGGIEAIKQPIVFNWKKEIASDYNFNDAFSNIVIAALGAGAIGGTAQSVADGLKRFINKNKIYGVKTSMYAANLVENHRREQLRSPDLNKDAAAHAQDLEGEVRYQQERSMKGAEEEVDARIQDTDSIPVDDSEVILEDLDGNQFKSTVAKEQQIADDLEKQMEAARGCV